MPSPKRLPSARLLEAGLRAGRSKVLPKNHPYGPGFIFADNLIFSHLLGPALFVKEERRFLDGV